MKNTNGVAIICFGISMIILFGTPRSYGARQSPVAVVPYMLRTIKLDGRIEDEEWKEAAIITGFSNLEGQLAERQTKVWLGYDKENLYVAFKSTTDYRQQPIKNRIWHSDAIEFFLSIPGVRGYLQFCGNSAGVQYVAWIGNERAKAPNWKMANFVDPDAWKVGETWSAEIAVPFAELGLKGLPKEGERWGANFCRDWSVASDKDEKYTSWSPVKGSYLQLNRFGTLVFSRKLPSVQLKNFAGVRSGCPKFKGAIIARKRADISIGYSVLSATDKPVTLVSRWKKILCEAGKSLPFDFTGDVRINDIVESIPVRLVFEARDENKNVLYRAIFPYELMPPFRVEVVPIFLQNRIDVVFDVRNFAALSSDIAGYASLIDAKDKVIDRAVAKMLGQKRQSLLKLHLPKCSVGRYVVKACLKDSKGKVVREVEKRVDVPAKPEWYGNKLGISDKVPPPFEDVRVNGKTVCVWGREYKLGAMLLPETIKTSNVGRAGQTQILAEPIGLRCVASGQRQEWGRTKYLLKSAKATGAVFYFDVQGADVSVSGRLKAEYDGMLIYDLTIAPIRNDVSISNLTLDIPIYRKDAAILRATTWPMHKMGERTKAVAALIGDIKPERPHGYFPKPTKDYVSIYNYLPDGWQWKDEFIPQLWVGNGRHGLFYFQDSPEDMNWKGSPVDVVHRGAKTIIRITYINVETKLNSSLHYKFALMGTPFKKRNRRMERIAFDRQWFTDCVKQGRLPKGFIPATVHWKAGRCEKDYKIVSPEKFRRQVIETRKQKMEVILNNSPCLYIKNSSEFSLYGNEWVEKPIFQYSNHDGSKVTLIRVCPNTSFTDYYLWWVKQLIENYDVGGLYFDVTGANGCKNRHHGHGYIKDGRCYAVSDMFALREFYKRIYTLVKEEGTRRGRTFVIYQHSGSAVCWPYVDLLCRGEYWERAGYAIKRRGWWTITPTYFLTVEDVLPMGGAYTFFCGINDRTGPGSPGPYQRLNQEKLAVLLLLDVLPCADKWMTPIFREQWPKKNKPGLYDIWKLWDDFDIGNAEWVPYYQKDSRVLSDSPSLKISFYVHKGRLLIVVANLTRQTISSELTVSRNRLGFASRQLYVKYIDTGQCKTIDNDKIPVTVAARDFSLLSVR